MKKAIEKVGEYADSNRFAPWLLIALLTGLEILTQKLVHAHFEKKILAASYNIATGHAEWRIYQSRILGPYLILGLSRLLHVSYGVAREIFVPAFLLGSNLLIFRLIEKQFESRRYGLKICFWHVTLFLCLQSSHFLYDWDVIDQLIFFLFAFGIFTRKGVIWFVALFAAELFNREAADFMAGYLCLRAITDAWGGKSIPRSLANFGLGVVLVVLCLLATHWLRETLHHDPAAEIGKYRIVLGQMWQVPRNLAEMLPPYKTGTQIYPWMVVAVLGWLIWRARRLLAVQAFESAVVTVLILASLFLFAVLTETRVLISLAPFLVLFGIDPKRWVNSFKLV